MNKRHSPSEPFLTIGDLAKEFGVTHRALRHYETAGLLSPRRKGRARLYSPSDRTRLRLILLGKRLGLTLLDIRDLLGIYDLGGMDKKALGTALGKCTMQLRVLKKEQDEIDQTIRSLERAIGILRRKLGSDMPIIVAGGWAVEASETACVPRRD